MRPFLVLCFFAFQPSVKVAQFVILQHDEGGSAAMLLSMWGEEDWAVWAAIVIFWFGSRAFNKERGADDFLCQSSERPAHHWRGR